MKTRTIYQLARAVAETLAHAHELQAAFESATGRAAAVHLGAIGTEVVDNPRYPYIVVTPSEESADDASRTRTVSVHLAARCDEGPGNDSDSSKPVAVNDVLDFGRGEVLVELAETIVRLLRWAPVGSRLTGWSADYDFNTYPVQSVALRMEYTDEFSFSEEP